ncbi:MAG TPA: YceI family protein [Telluria sp.]|nr:YceI family protein [Telluria sp.]
MNMKHLIAAFIAAGAATAAIAAPDTYMVEPGHTYPSFEADHMGISILRGKFTKTSGTIVLDRAAKTGSLDITIDASTLDFGNEKLNGHAKGADMFDVAKFPTATYKSKSITFKGDMPATVNGELTLHGVTKPVVLTINKFKCIQHPMLKREVCGADASATFNRADFGIDYAVKMGFNPEVKLAIQVEGVKQ